jgi:excisionase family DNA binding protein
VFLVQAETEREEAAMHLVNNDRTNSTAPIAPTPGEDGPNDNTTAATNRCLRTQEAARHLGISRAKLYQLITSGELESITIGRSRRVPLDALADYISKRRAIAKQN